MIYYYLDFNNLDVVNETQYGFICETLEELNNYFSKNNIIPSQDCILKFDHTLTDNTCFIFHEKSRTCFIQNCLNMSEICMYEKNTLKNGTIIISNDFVFFLYKKT